LRFEDNTVIISQDNLDICRTSEILWPRNPDPQHNASLKITRNPIEGIVL
jgi:hypothetical protein